MKQFGRKKIIAIVVCVLGIYAISFGTGLKGVSPGGSGGGSSTTTKKTCQEMYGSITRDFLINELHLTYDLALSSNYISATDIAQLQAAHGGFASEQGEFRFLESIVQGHQYALEDDRRPVCKITLSGTDCTGTISKNYTSVNEVLGNKVLNIPDFGLQLQSMKFEIKTIRTIGHEVQLAWTASLNFEQSSGYVVVDTDAQVSCTRSAFYIIDNKEGLIPVRRSTLSDDGIEIYTPVGNCIYDVSLTEDSQYIVSDEVVLKTITLDRPIYSGGVFSKDLEWDAPILLEQIGD